MEKRKGILTGLSLAMAASILVGCGTDPKEPPIAPTITDSDAVALGALIRLIWSAVTDATEYRVYSDGTLVESTTNTQADIDSTNVSSIVGVSALGEGGESGQAQEDLSLTETTSLDVWSIQDPDSTHPSFVRFNSDGSAVAVPCSQSNTAHFFIGGVAGSLQFRSIQNMTNPCNDNTNVDPFFNDTGGIDYAGSDFAPPSGYNDPQGITDQGVYYIWVDNAPFGTWETTDFYAKVKVTAVSGLMTTLQIGYQKEGGLRWLK
ncbi:hypothetical protein IIA15_09705 [candidate division TA06 bacterium]|nr:hypothetical protein [candidate division TA06 bacterium]